MPRNRKKKDVKAEDLEAIDGVETKGIFKQTKKGTRSRKREKEKVKRFHVLGFEFGFRTIAAVVAWASFVVGSALLILLVGILFKDEINILVITPLIHMMSQGVVSDIIGTEWFHGEYQIEKTAEDQVFAFKMVGQNDHFLEINIQERYEDGKTKYKYHWMKFWIVNEDGTRTFWEIDNFDLRASIRLSDKDKGNDGRHIYDKLVVLNWITVEKGYVFEKEILADDNSDQVAKLKAVEKQFKGKKTYSRRDDLERIVKEL